MEKAGKEKMRGLKAVRKLMCVAQGQREVSSGNLTSACSVLTDGCTPLLLGLGNRCCERLQQFGISCLWLNGDP